LQGDDDASDEEGAEALAEPTEELLKILFDVQTYRAALLEYDIDPNLMPLGKLSRRHVEQGLALLTEVQASLDDATLSPERRAAALADASNRFNTLVPHSQPLLIDSKPALARKVR
jgi:poly [ADP-ribose] polymerase